MIYLSSISIKPGTAGGDMFPFNVPLIRNLGEIEFSAPLTLFVGENGSGKSVLLESMAAGIGSATVGGEDIDSDETLKHARALGAALRFVWAKKTRRGFFLRAEDFFRYTRRLCEMIAEFEREANELKEKYPNGGIGVQMAMSSLMGQRAALIRKYGVDLDAHSHGESFLKLFQERFTPGGLYLLDEPETPLSPTRQLTLLSIFKGMVEDQRAQFVIATHSPILMACPNATIYSFDQCPARQITYQETEHVSLTRRFLNDPEDFLRHL
jgi:predicted ATPase